MSLCMQTAQVGHIPVVIEAVSQAQYCHKLAASPVGLFTQHQLQLALQAARCKRTGLHAAELWAAGTPHVAV